MGMGSAGTHGTNSFSGLEFGMRWRLKLFAESKEPGPYHRFGDNAFAHLALALAALAVNDGNLDDAQSVAVNAKKKLHKKRIAARLNGGLRNNFGGIASVGSEAAGCIEDGDAENERDVAVGKEAQEQARGVPVEDANSLIIV